MEKTVPVAVHVAGCFVGAVIELGLHAYAKCRSGSYMWFAMEPLGEEAAEICEKLRTQMKNTETEGIWQLGCSKILFDLAGVIV